MSEICPISKEQSLALKIMTFVLTVLVVLRHSMNLHLFYEGGHAWLPVADINIAVQRFCTELTHVAVPGFFFISGFLFFHNLDNVYEIGRKLKTRVRSLLIPYLSWNLLMLLFWTGISLIPFLYPQMVKTFGMEYTFRWFVSKLTLQPIVGQFWYVRTLILFVCLSPLVYIALISRCFSLIVFYCLISIWLPIDTGILSSEGAVFFYLGGYFAKYIGLPKKIPLQQWIWLVPVGMLLILQSIFQFLPLRIPFGVNLGVTLLFLWQLCMFMACCPQTNQLFLNLSNHSFFIYALHDSLISCISVLIARVVPHTPCISLIVFCGGFLATVFSSICISWLCRKCFPKVYSIFSGGR